MYLGPPSKHDHFYPFLILPVTMVELPTIVELHLKCGRVLDPPCMKTSPVLCETSLFPYYFEMWPPLSKVIVFLCYVLFNSLLEGCYHYLIFMDPVNGYSKSKLLLKEQVSLKSKITFGYVCFF